MSWTEHDEQEMREREQHVPTAKDVYRAASRLARLTHLREQSETSAKVVGGLVGAYVAGLMQHELPPDLLADMASDFLDKILPDHLVV